MRAFSDVCCMMLANDNYLALWRAGAESIRVALIGRRRRFQLRVLPPPLNVWCRASNQSCDRF